MILDHVHGTSNNRCDHPDCKAAFARYCKRWRLDVAHGRKRLVDAEPVRLHICTLHGLGWSTRAIAGTAGISPSVVSKLALGQAKVSRKIAAAVMRVDVDSLPVRPSNQVDEPTVPKMGACRRIEALLALGWTHDAQRAHCGVATHLVLAQRGRWVYRSTHDKIAAMYRELSTKPGPSERTRRRAAKRGYATPAEWDDVDHDAEPDRVYVLKRATAHSAEWRLASDDDAIHQDDLDHAIVERFIDSGERVRKLTHAEGVEIVRRLRARGVTTSDMEHLYGLKPERYASKSAAS